MREDYRTNEKLAKVVIGYWGTILLIVVIPIAINEFYKADTVYYVSMWDAADVLSYYGTVLGAVAAVTALVATIAYYRKQIIYEKTLQREQDQWAKKDYMNFLVEIYGKNTLGRLWMQV